MKIVIFGECIFDETENGLAFSGNHIGLALHAAKLGAKVKLISAVEPSPLSEQALAFLEQSGIDTTLVARIRMPAEAENALPPFEYIPLPSRLPDADLCYYSVLPLRGELSKNTLKKLLSLGQYPSVAADFSAFHAPLDTLPPDCVLSQSTVLRFSPDNPSYQSRGMEDFASFLREKYPSLRYFYTEPQPGKVTLYDGISFSPYDTALPVGSLPPAILANSFFTDIVCTLASGKEPEEAIGNAQRLGTHICAEGEALPYPNGLCRDIITPLHRASEKRRTPKSHVLITIYAILISIAFIVSTSFAAYFFITLQYDPPEYTHPDGTEEDEQEQPHTFPPLSERPLYAGDDLTVPSPEDAESKEELTARQLIEITKPSVVCVQSDQGEGTGFIITETGYIVTNHHIIDKGTQFTVILHDDTVFDAKFVGSDELTDVAVLKIEPGETVLRPIPLGNSDTVRAGDPVIAIGSPGGSEYAGTATSGIVSAASRRLTTSVLSGEGSRTLWVIQSDTAVNFGNSGGPLLNMKGQVIGINTLKYAELYFEGLGFSLPINGVMDIVNLLMKNGEIHTYPEDCFAKINVPLGITVTSLSKSELEKNRLTHGIRVEEVTEKSNAALDGVLQGDIILTIDGREARSTLQVRNAVFDHYAGDKIPLTVYRNGQILDIEVTLRPKTE